MVYDATTLLVKLFYLGLDYFVHFEVVEFEDCFGEDLTHINK